MKITAPPPEELIDPDGEGIYLLDDPDWQKGVFGLGVHMRAADALQLIDDAGRLDWRSVNYEVAYMEPVPDSDEWRRASTGRWPRYWRLNLPKRRRPVLYAYCTPPSEPAKNEEQHHA